MRILLTTFLTSALLLSSTTEAAPPAIAPAISPAQVAGTWQGTLDAGPKRPRIVLQLHKGTGPAWSASLYSIDVSSARCARRGKRGGGDRGGEARCSGGAYCAAVSRQPLCIPVERGRGADRHSRLHSSAAALTQVPGRGRSARPNTGCRGGILNRCAARGAEQQTFPP